jgi:O-antigen/teichoic acid export membrane protein
MRELQKDPYTHNSKGFFGMTGVGKSVRVYLPATVIYRGMSFFRGIVLAWMLARATGQYGLLSIALQAINILAPLVSMGLNEAVTRYVPAYQQDHQLRRFLSLAGSLILGLSIVLTLGLIFFSNPLSRAIFAGASMPAEEVTSLTLATFVSVFAIIVYFLVVAILKGLRMFTALAVMELVHGLLFLGLSLLAVLIIAPRADVVIWSYTLAMLIPTVIWTLGLIKKIPADRPEYENAFVPTAIVRRLTVFGFWSAVGGVVWQTWQIYSLWHLTKFDSAHDGDILAAARLLGQLILVVASALSSVVLTHVCTIWEKGEHKSAFFLHDLYTKVIMLSLLSAAMLLVILRDPLAWIFPAKFGEVSSVLPSVVTYYQLSAMLSFLAIQFVMLEKMRQILWPWLAGLIGNILLAIWMIHGEQALIGAADAASLSTLPAIGIAILILRVEGGSISKGLILVTFASGILLLPSWLAIPAFGMLIGWAIAGKTLFTPEQKLLIASKLPFYKRNDQRS